MAATTALSHQDLFRRYQPRFRRIVLTPHSFGVGNQHQQHLFYFAPRHIGAMSDIHATEYRGSGDNGNFLQFDVRRGKFAFTLNYDPTGVRTIDQQLNAAAGAAIVAGPLKDREFYVEPLEGCDPFGREISIALTYPGDEIPGLVIPTILRATTWGFFFPESSEREAIELTLEVQKRQKMLEDIMSANTRQIDLNTQVTNLTVDLEAALKAAG
ncbi:MAG: hypothetical protein AAB919_01275 [Patescibacteria group bacterium]